MSYNPGNRMSTVQTETKDHVATITIANPPHGYLNEEVTAEIDKATRRAVADDAVKVIVITGGLPGIFIQHYDLHEVESVARFLNERKARYGDGVHVAERKIDLILRRLESCPKPVIAAINGNAMGGGMELALACDFRIAQNGPFQLGLPEILIGTLPGAGGTQRLARLVGAARALDLVLHGRRLNPEQALANGLLTELVEGSALARAHERAAELARIPPKALAYVKRLVLEASGRPLYQGLDLERTLFMDLLASPEALKLVGELNAAGRDFRTIA